MYAVFNWSLSLKILSFSEFLCQYGCSEFVKVICEKQLDIGLFYVVVIILLDSFKGIINDLLIDLCWLLFIIDLSFQLCCQFLDFVQAQSTLIKFIKKLIDLLGHFLWTALFDFSEHALAVLIWILVQRKWRERERSKLVSILDAITYINGGLSTILIESICTWPEK